MTMTTLPIMTTGNGFVTITPTTVPRDPDRRFRMTSGKVPAGRFRPDGSEATVPTLVTTEPFRPAVAGSRGTEPATVNWNCLIYADFAVEADTGSGFRIINGGPTWLLSADQRAVDELVDRLLDTVDVHGYGVARVSVAAVAADGRVVTGYREDVLPTPPPAY